MGTEMLAPITGPEADFDFGQRVEAYLTGQSDVWPVMSSANQVHTAKRILSESAGLKDEAALQRFGELNLAIFLFGQMETDDLPEGYYQAVRTDIDTFGYNHHSRGPR